MPALLITNRHPLQFRRKKQGDFVDDNNFKMIIIPFRRISNEPTEVVKIIDKVFKDLRDNKDLNDFQISKEMKKGVGRAIVDSIMLEPNFSGIGFSFNKLRQFLKM